MRPLGATPILPEPAVVELPARHSELRLREVNLAAIEEAPEAFPLVLLAGFRGGLTGPEVLELLHGGRRYTRAAWLTLLMLAEDEALLRWRDGRWWLTDHGAALALTTG